MIKEKHEITLEMRKKKFIARIIALAILVVIITAITIGIVSLTRNAKLRKAEKVVREAMELVVEERGEAGLLEIFSALENFTEDGVSGLLPALGYENSSGYNNTELQNIEIYERYNKAVVNISTEFYEYSPLSGAVPESGKGSGTIIDSSGYILTNYHVVEGAEEVLVSLYDGSVYTGTITGRDRENDLAVVKVDLDPKVEITTIEFGTSANLKIGQKVLAIGNPFGYDRTLTTGIVSGLGRPLRISDDLIILDMIQTDASINPGNSGGPLLDSRGRMIGINTTIFTTNGGSVGIGFAVPADTAKRVIPELIDHGKVVRGWIDIVPVQLDAQIVEYAQMEVESGLLVSRVESNGKAEKAGLKGGNNRVKYGNAIIQLGGDIIVGADGLEITDLADLFSALEDNKPGDVVELKIVRDGEELIIPVELIERPEQYEWN